jgi:PBSX family phage terminase large subunit
MSSLTASVSGVPLPASATDIQPVPGLALDRGETAAAEQLRPHDEQEPFLTRHRRFVNWTSGIGAGKTVAGLIRVVANVQRWNPGELGVIITPTVPALKNVILPEMRRWGFLEEWEYRGPRSEEPGLHAPNGARILLESANNERKIERLRGPSVAWFWIDEAATVPRKAWDIMTGRLRAGAYRNAFVTTTPKGYNWIHDRFVDGLGDVRPEQRGAADVLDSDDTRSILRVPTDTNPHLPEDYVESIRGEYSGSFFRQEVLGEFTKFEGLVYPWFSEHDHVVGETPDRYDDVVYGVDWGFNAPSAVLAVVRQGDRRVVAESFHERRCTVDDIGDVLEQFVDRWGEGPIYCDPAEPGSIYDLQSRGLGARKADNDVTPGIQTVAAHQDDLAVHESCQAVINEFGQYRYPEGDDDADRPVKANDHAMDALRYALHTDRSRTEGESVSRIGSVGDLF